MTQHPPALDRRQVLVGTAALAARVAGQRVAGLRAAGLRAAGIGAAGIAAVGCGKDTESTVQSTPQRRDVPLRVVQMGTAEEADSIVRGWGAVSELPLDLKSIPLDRSASVAFEDQMLSAARASDVIIYPLSLMAEIVSKEVVVELSDKDVEAINLAAGELLPTLRNGAARYAGEIYAAPLGGLQPALLSADELPEIKTWQDYDQHVDQVWGGSASEPTAPGWAAATYLTRAAVSKNWLFNRQSLDPVITSDHYLDALKLMIQTHDRYESKRQRPDQVFDAVKSGQLKGGIGFPVLRSDASGDLQIGNVPSAESYGKVLLDPYSPVISVSANCRQTAAAKQFISWISGGEGSESVRQQVAGMTRVRREDPNVGATDSTAVNASDYDRWLEFQLTAPIHLPTLQILRAGEYYQVLDQQIGRALEKSATPEEALAEVSRQWQATTEKVGVDKQRRAWRRAQGMRA